ncbi:hypothetical protein HDA39_005954 [Kribbella italica]|uniref:Uncharacterized protein n=1 Tax=Kribbella italica TaxID=1540520 RepID=A0A7W9MXC4_9ACTN|nr:hypothetical protein [Kribbella italica]
MTGSPVEAESLTRDLSAHPDRSTPPMTTLCTYGGTSREGADLP